MVFIIWSQGFIFSKWVSLERNSSSFLFLGIEFDFRAGFLSKNGGILLSGGRGRMWEVSELLTERWMCCQIWRQGLCPQGLLLPGLFFVVSFCEPWSGEFILWGCVPIAARKKKKDGRQNHAAAYFMVTALCGRVMWQSLMCDIDPLPLNQTQCDWKGRLQKEPISAESKPSVLLPTTDLLFRGRKSPSV